MIVRLAEPLVALTQASDLGVGLSTGHSARTAYLAARYALELGLNDETRSAVFYAGLLRTVGCLADAHQLGRAVHASDLTYKGAAWFVDFGKPREALAFAIRTTGSAVPFPLRPIAIVEAMQNVSTVYEGLREQCEVGALLATELDLGDQVTASIQAGWDRWDGKGVYGRRGEEIPLPMRIVMVASVAEVFTIAFGSSMALDALRRQSGTALDSELADGFGDWAKRADPWPALDADSLTPDLLALEPAGTRRSIDDGGVERMLRSFGDLADLKTPWTVGHARGTSWLASDAARRLGLSCAEVAAVQRAGFVADIGRAAIPNTILDKTSALTQRDREVIRLHPYQGERILASCPVLAALAPLVGSHHERLDGSGYVRGSSAGQQPIVQRVLAAADVAHALVQDRPHRRGLAHEQVPGRLRAEVAAGRLDADCVTAVGDALVGARTRARSAGLGLTERELTVMRLLVRQQSLKQIAGELRISPKTVDHHVQHIYGKFGVTTRAGAVLVAVQRGLVNVE